MIDFKNMLISIKTMWVKRLLVNNNVNPYKPKWKNLGLFTAGMADTTLLLHKLSIEMLPQC